MKAHTWWILVPMLVTAAVPLSAQVEDASWPSWRGPSGTGCASAGNPPIEWSESKNIKWKIALPGTGISSPIVWKNRIYLTTAIATDRKGTSTDSLGPPHRNSLPRPTVVHEFRVIAVDRHDGKVAWNRKVTEAVPHEGGHRTNTHASNSAITDGTHVFANFGSRGIYCLDLAGAIVWSKQLGVMRTRRHYGEASSPTLFGDRLIVNFDHEGDSFIVVFDKNTGRELWRRPRDEVTSWSTPMVIEVDGRPQVIISATTATRGYDLATGKVIWFLGGMTVNCIPHPIHANGVVFVMSGYRGNMLQAIKLAGAQGDLADTEHVLWSHGRNTSYVPSAMLLEDCYYFLRGNNAVLSCVDAKTGEVHYEGQRMRGLRSVYASPVGVAGHIYITSRGGITRVIKHGTEFQEIATNSLDDEVDASLAIIGDEIYLRGRRHLYCIAKTAPTEVKTGVKKNSADPSAFHYRSVGTLGDAEARTASISVGDIDGDGHLDLVVANGRHWPGQNLVFRNDGKGRFPAGKELSSKLSTSYTTALGDMDGDGDLDVVVGNDRHPSYVVWNDGKGNFKMGPQVGKISNTRSVTLADLDGVNGLDVILTNRREANLICFNDGKGGFARRQTFGAQTDSTINVATGDFDGDGDVDIAVANRGEQQNHVYFNDGKGNFTVKRPYGTGSDRTRGIKLADVDSDGNLDILNANIGEPNAVYFGDGKGGFARTAKFGADAMSYAVAAADVNGDGRLDVLVANVRTSNAIYLQRADRGFTRIPFGLADGVTYGLVVADWNGDGRPEIATANSDGKNHLYQWIAGPR